MNYHEAWANGEIEAGTLVDAIEEQTAELADIKANRDALLLVHRVGRSLDQQRIETAADNCEVLRARLARYEDADGKPITTIAEQAREIERLQLTCNDIDDQNDRIYAELAALKSQPARVVPAALGSAFITCESGDAGYRVVIKSETLQEAQQVHNWLARLNSSPDSAGDDRETIRAVFLRNGFTIKEGQADLKPYVYAAADELMSIARAALSAPSHGEQVRHMVPAGWKLVPVEPTPEMISAAEEAHMPFGDMDIALRCALFAAPSAGSQEQGE